MNARMTGFTRTLKN